MPLVLQSTATPNNQYLVWDRLNGNFIGTMEGDKLKAQLLFNFRDGEGEYGGLVHPDGTVRQLLVDGCTDDDGTHEGMVFESEVDVGDREGHGAHINVELEHYHGAWATFAEADGVSERVGPLQEVPDATVRKTFGDSTYDITNTDDDQLQSHREDYANLINETGVYISEENGWMMQQRQNWVQKFRFRKRARSIRVRIESMRGWVGISKIAERLRPRGFGRGRQI